MKGYKHVKAKEYAQIKSFLGAGVVVSQIAKVLGRSTTTIGVIKKSSSLEDYHEKIRLYAVRQRKAKTPKETQVEFANEDRPPHVELSDAQMIFSELHSICEVLGEIRDIKREKLEYAKKRTWFGFNSSGGNGVS